MTQSRRQRVAAIGDVPPGAVRHYAVEGVREGVALCNVGGSLHALADMCTHAFAMLSEGYLDDDLLVCPLHGGGFEVASGEAALPPCSVAVQTFPVEVDGDDVYVLV